MNKILLILGVLLLAKSARADSTFVDTSASVADTSVQIDTVLYLPGRVLIPYESVTNPENLEKHLSQNPTAALFKSMLIPGLGQIGNRKYFKATIFMGLDAWFIGAIIHYGRQASDFRRQYEESTDIPMRNDYYDLYQDRKDERNKFTWYAVIVSFVSMFDAYVDAHLSGFPKKTEGDLISFNFRRHPQGEVMACVSVSF